MKKVLSLFNIRITFVLLAVAPIYVFSQTEMIKWDFPVKPGTEAWKLLRTNQQKIDACQIPSSILKKICTEDLVKICLNYPLFVWIYSESDILKCIGQTFLLFNGFQELFLREDAAECLLHSYQNLEIGKIKKLENLHTIGEFAFNLTYLEVLMAEKQVYENTSSKVRELILKELLYKFEGKLQLTQIFPLIAFRTNVFTMGKIALNEGIICDHQNESNSEILYFLHSMELKNRSVLDSITTKVRKHVNK